MVYAKQSYKKLGKKPVIRLKKLKKISLPKKKK